MIVVILNLYNRVWSYASINEMLAILGATMLSTVFQAFGFSLLYLQVPRSYYFFYFILLSITMVLRLCLVDFFNPFSIVCKMR